MALHCSHAIWTVEAGSEGEEGRREGRGNWPVEAHGGASWWRWCWRWRLQAAVFLSSLLYFFAFFFSSLFFSSFFFRSSAPSLFCYAPSPSFFFLASPPFVFIGKTRGGKTPTTPAKGVGWSGRPLCSRPRTALGVHPLFFHHVASKWGVLSASFWWFRKKRERKQGRKVFFFPCSLRV